MKKLYETYSLGEIICYEIGKTLKVGPIIKREVVYMILVRKEQNIRMKAIWKRDTWKKKETPKDVETASRIYSDRKRLMKPKIEKSVTGFLIFVSITQSLTDINYSKVTIFCFNTHQILIKVPFWSFLEN